MAASGVMFACIGLASACDGAASAPAAGGAGAAANPGPQAGTVPAAGQPGSGGMAAPAGRGAAGASGMPMPNPGGTSGAGMPNPGTPAQPTGPMLDPTKAPAENFDLKQWKLQLPLEKPGTGKVLEIDENELNGKTGMPYTHPKWFFTDPRTGAMVLRARNDGFTTSNSMNARSELREMVRRGDTRIGTKDPGNNWVLSKHPDKAAYGGVGGMLNATLAVAHVSTSGQDNRVGAHAVIVGQIHATTDEPLKIYYRKLPNHTNGSLFWVYEVPGGDDQRHDIWGAHRKTKTDPDPADGIPLNEPFSYQVEVKQSIMKLTFTKADGTVFNAEQNLDAYRNHDFYFKAGAYNQCNSRSSSSHCTTKGVPAGDYAEVHFFALQVGH